MNRITVLSESLVFARAYTVSLLGNIPGDTWFIMPAGCPSHIAWQVGHLAMAEARLVLDRVCGRHSEKEGILPEGFLTRFGRMSQAAADPAEYPPLEVIGNAFNRIHDITLETLASVREEDLDEPAEGPPHRLCKTRGEFLRWASHHEMLHAGQIGLMRRLLGQAGCSQVLWW